MITLVALNEVARKRQSMPLLQLHVVRTTSVLIAIPSAHRSGASQQTEVGSSMKSADVLHFFKTINLD